MGVMLEAVIFRACYCTITLFLSLSSPHDILMALALIHVWTTLHHFATAFTINHILDVILNTQTSISTCNVFPPTPSPLPISLPANLTLFCQPSNAWVTTKTSPTATSGVRTPISQQPLQSAAPASQAPWILTA